MVMFVDEDSESAMGDESSLGFSGRSRCCFCVSGELFISQQKFSEEVGDGSSADGGVDLGLVVKEFVQDWQAAPVLWWAFQSVLPTVRS